MLSRLEWLVLAVALLLCPGFSWGAETADEKGIVVQRLLFA